MGFSYRVALLFWLLFSFIYFGILFFEHIKMTSTTWNPLVHLKHAWSNTKTRWGQLAIVLFYSLIWIAILSCVWALIVPESQGLYCIMDNFKEGVDRDLYITAYNGYNVFVIGFLLYADMGGLHIRNVVMVVIFVFLNAYVCVYQTTKLLSDLDCMSAIRSQMWIFPLWTLAALVFTIVDEKLGDNGSSDERQPLSA
jgi:hypothetical protein